VIRGFVAGAVLAVLVGLGIGLGLGASGLIEERRETGAVAPAPASVQLSVAPEGSDESATIELFRAARDSVVAISTSASQRDFFGRSAGEVPLGTGSGWLWDAQGMW
jgi:hypothetical protein